MSLRGLERQEREFANGFYKAQETQGISDMFLLHFPISKHISLNMEEMLLRVIKSTKHKIIIDS